MNQLALHMPEPREAGMEAAIDHAGHEWRNAAFTFICQYARQNPGPYTAEDVSDAFLAAGNPEPPDLRAFGALWRKAVAEAVVERLDAEGWSKRRASPTYRYASLVCAHANSAPHSKHEPGRAVGLPGSTPRAA